MNEKDLNNVVAVSEGGDNKPGQAPFQESQAATGDYAKVHTEGDYARAAATGDEAQVQTDSMRGCTGNK